MNSGSFVSGMFQRSPPTPNPLSIDKTPPNLKMSAGISNSLFTPPPPSPCTLQYMQIPTLLTPLPPIPPFKLSKAQSVTLKYVVVQETLKTFSE